MDVVDGFVFRGVIEGSDVASAFESINSASLLEQARREGGGKVFSLLLEVVEALREHNMGQLLEREKALTESQQLCWEKLHTGAWENVSECWRHMYALCALLLGHIHALRGHWAETSRLLDLIVLMGHSHWHALAHAALKRVPVPQQAIDMAALKWPDVAPLSLCAELLKFPLLPDCAALPTLSDFEAQFLKRGVPCLLPGLAKEWPATHKWKDPAYLGEVLGSRVVPIELGKNYMHADWSQQLMPFSQFFARHIVEGQQPVGYLAQTELLQQVPALWKDILVPDYCSMGTSSATPTVNAWFGPAGTVSPLHTDPHQNIFVQLAGSKVLLLFSPSESEHLYQNQEGVLTNTSLVDAEQPDLEKFPNYRSAQGYLAIVNAGDGLFIPKGTWHFVKSLQPSWSLSFWFD